MTVLLAHGGGGGGSWAVPALFAAVALVGWGLSRRHKEGVKRWSVWAPVALGVLVAIAGIVSADIGKKSDVHVVIVEPVAGATVAANTPIRVLVTTDGDLASGPEDRSGGHLHVAVDGKLEQMPYGTDLLVTLPPGKHAVTVEYVDNQHASYKPKVEQTITLIAR